MNKTFEEWVAENSDFAANIDARIIYDALINIWKKLYGAEVPMPVEWPVQVLQNLNMDTKVIYFTLMQILEVIKAGGLEIVLRHNMLSNRALPEQHPMSAISGLLTAFENVYAQLFTRDQAISNLENNLTILRNVVYNNVAWKHTRYLQNGSIEVIDWQDLFRQLDGVYNKSVSLGAKLDTNGAITFFTEKTVADSEVMFFTYNIISKILTVKKGDGSSISVTLPEATAEDAGLMAAADVRTLIDLQQKVANILEGGIWRATFNTYADLTAAYPNLNVSSTNWTVNDFIYVNKDENRNPSDPHAVSYIVQVNDSLKTLTYRRDEDLPIVQATNSSLGVVKGNANEAGKVYVETDGTMSVIGWDALGELLGNKLEKVDGYADYLAQFGADGGLASSGKKISELALYNQTIVEDDTETDIGTSAITDTVPNFFQKFRRGLNWLKEQKADKTQTVTIESDSVNSDLFAVNAPITHTVKVWLRLITEKINGLISRGSMTNEESELVIQSVRDSVYPVGTIYESVVNRNPAEFIGGTWTVWGAGRVSVGVDASDADFNTVEKPGGASTVTLTKAQIAKHTHTQERHYHAPMGHIHSVLANSHTHNIPTYRATSGQSTGNVAQTGFDSDLRYHITTSATAFDTQRAYENGEYTVATNYENNEGGGSHDNKMKYITSYKWKRTA